MGNLKENKANVKILRSVFIVILLVIAFIAVYYMNNKMVKETPLLSKAEVQSVLGTDGAVFCIENIDKDENEYIITATMLEKEPRMFSDSEIEELKNGKKIEFRGQKWKLKNENEDVIEIESDDDALMLDKTQRTLLNVAGVARDLCDYSEQKIKFKVSNDILIGTFWSNFKYDENGNKKAYGLGEFEEEITDYKGISFEQLQEFSKGCKGTYDECIAYVKDGVVGAIRIGWK